MSSDPFNLQRFVEAQAGCIEAVRAELRSGRKRSHWMWYVFPQLRGLGASAASEHFGISGRDEAVAYLAHVVLGPRLVECTELVLAAKAHPIDAILGYPDNLKFRSSMTLFSEVAPGNAIFRNALAAFFKGEPDAETLRLLRSA